MARPRNLYFSRTDPMYDCDFNHFESFDCLPRPQWMIDIASKYDVTLDPAGSPFQTGLLLDTTETPGYTMSTAGSQTGKSRALLIEAIIMATGKVPIAFAFDKGVDTGHPRKVTPENIKRWGQREDGGCGNIIGLGKYPLEKIPPENSGAQIWIASFQEVKKKMWKPKLDLLIPPTFLQDSRGNGGWSFVRQTFTFTTGTVIRLISFEQGYKKAEGEMAWLCIVDEESPTREFFISALEHSKYLRLSFTPISGLSWAYYDAYLPALNKSNKNVKIFSCTQFDSPFQKREKVEEKLSTYRDYEVKSRVFGQFSETVGKPYYSYDITQTFLKAYIPRHTLGRIIPMSKPEFARDAINIKMRLEPAEAVGDDVFEIYEKMTDYDAYWLSADVAEGNEDPELAGDASVAYVRRLPRADEKDPVMVAALQSHLRNVEFAWTCLWAAVYYNCCLIAPETGVSADGAVFITTIQGYPYLYRHTNTNDKTHRVQEKFGFDSKSSTRKYAFDLVGSWIVEHLDNSKIYHYPLLKELSECITGKGGRPDHPERGSTDCIMAFGISEYVRDLAKTQIRCNRQMEMEDSSYHAHKLFPNIIGLDPKLVSPARETRPVIGSRRGMDAKFGVMKMANNKTGGF